MLAALGWVENPDPKSPYWDFKWATKYRSISKWYGRLSKNHLVNHAPGTHEIGDKNLLLHNLRWKMSKEEFAWSVF